VWVIKKKTGEKNLLVREIQAPVKTRKLQNGGRKSPEGQAMAQDLDTPGLEGPR